MGIQERKEREREERRQRILAAAAHLFSTQGVEKTTLRNIAQEIEYSPGTIYLYFKDKEELLNDLYKVMFAGFSQKLLEAASVDDPMDRLQTIGEKYLEYARLHPAEFDLMFMMKHRDQSSTGEAAPHMVDCDPNNVSALEATDDGFAYMRATLIRINDLPDHKLRYDIDTATVTAWGIVHGIAALEVRGMLNIYPEPYRKQLVTQTLASIQHALVVPRNHHDIPDLGT